MKRRIVIAGLSACVVVTTLFFGACSNGGEGDRCDVNADNGGNDDCQNGLVCVPAAQLSGTGQQSALCCPGDRALSSAGSPCALVTPSNGLGADSAIPAEAAVSDAPVSMPDAAPDAAPDAIVVVDAADASDGG